MKNIPQYLKKYIVNQNYDQYSFIDHACWRFIMRINHAYFSDNAHSSYLEGIEKTGITIDKIPRIEDINKKLQNFGWSAVGVKGFLPPLIFMDFQSKGIAYNGLVFLAFVIMAVTLLYTNDLICYRLYRRYFHLSRSFI